LLLRGPQTPGELRTRTNRLADFADVSEVESALEALQDLNGQTLVKKLAREPGKRESRYVQLLSDFDENALTAASENSQPEQSQAEGQSSLNQRVAELEEKIAQLTEQVNMLNELLEPE
jgi:hypothetical protein